MDIEAGGGVAGGAAAKIKSANVACSMGLLYGGNAAGAKRKWIGLVEPRTANFEPGTLNGQSVMTPFEVQGSMFDGSMF